MVTQKARQLQQHPEVNKNTIPAKGSKYHKAADNSSWQQLQLPHTASHITQHKHSICVQSFYPNTCHALRSDSTAKPSYPCRCTGPSTFHPSSDCLVTCACARPLTADCAVRAGHCSMSRIGGQNWTRLFKTLLLYIMQESMNNMTPNNTPHNTHSRTPQQPHISSYVNPWKVCQSKN